MKQRPKNRRKRPTNVVISEPLKARAKAYAEQKGQSLSSIVSGLLYDELEKHANKQEGGHGTAKSA